MKSNEKETRLVIGKGYPMDDRAITLDGDKIRVGEEILLNPQGETGKIVKILNYESGQAGIVVRMPDDVTWVEDTHNTKFRLLNPLG